MFELRDGNLSSSMSESRGISIPAPGGRNGRTVKITFEPNKFSMIDLKSQKIALLKVVIPFFNSKKRREAKVSI